MVIPDTFGVRGERTIVSYDWINLTEGTGNITYYAGSGLNDSATELSILKSDVYYSNSIEISYTTTSLSQSFAIKKELNYDLSTNNLPLIIKGTATCIISWGVYGVSGAIITGYLKAKLIKVSEGAETIIGTGQTKEIAKDGVGYETQVSTMILNLNQTHFKIGDTIRLSIEGLMKNNTGGHQGRIAWGQDPKNRDGTIFTPSSDNTITKTHITIPFKINL